MMDREGDELLAAYLRAKRRARLTDWLYTPVPRWLVLFTSLVNSVIWLVIVLLYWRLR